jgi:cytoskeletal protein CcmA (bactofilin family)
MTEISNTSFFEFGVVTDTSKIIGSVLNDGLIRANNSNIFIKSGNINIPALTIGTNNKVAIGKNIANEAFDVSGSLIAKEYRIKNQNYPIIDSSSNIIALGNLDLSGNLTLNSNKFVVDSSTGKLSVAGTLDISKNININIDKTIIDLSGNIKSQGNFDLSNNININNNVLVDTSGSVIMNNNLDISNNATLSSLDIKGNIKSDAFTTNSSINKVCIRNTSIDPSYNLHVVGSTRFEGNLDVDGDIIVVDTVQETSEQFIINNDGNTVALTINQIGAQPIIDLRDDNKSVFYLADNGLLGLGTTTPSYTVDVSGNCNIQKTLDISGNLNIDGNTYLSENIQFNNVLDISRNLNINNKFFVDPSGNVDICGNMLIHGYLIGNGINYDDGFQQDGDIKVNGELRVLYNIDISQNLRVLDTFIVDTSGNIKSKGTFDLSNNLRNGSNFNINTVGNIYSSGNIDISKNFTINNGVFSADVSGNIIVNGFIDISKNLYVNGNKFTIDQNGNITAMGNLDLSQNLTINTNKFIVDANGNIKSASNLDISNNFIINNGTFKIDNNGNISSQNNFDISGNMSINGSNFTVSNTGNIKSIGTLDISNNFSINNDKFKVDISGNTIAKGNIDISNNLSIGNNKFNVDASGNIKSSGTLDISKNLKIGNTLLTVDYQNKRVGINTTTPEYSLDISGQLVINKGIMGPTFNNNATFGHRDASGTFIPSIIQLNSGQTFINSLSQYINFNFGNDNKCKMDSNGNLILNGDIYIYSDGRIKENVTTITSALDKVNEISGITYNMINKSRREIGVIAQEVEQVLPEVIQEEGGLKTVAYSNMIGLLIEALKELNDKVDQSI